MSLEKYAANRLGVKALLFSPQLDAEIMRVAQRVAAEAKRRAPADVAPHIVVQAVDTPNRERARVVANTATAKRAKTNYLVQALDAAKQRTQGPQLPKGGAA